MANRKRKIVLRVPVTAEEAKLFFHPAHQRPAVQGTGAIRGEAGPGQGPVLCRVGRPAAGPELESKAENRYRRRYPPGQGF